MQKLCMVWLLLWMNVSVTASNLSVKDLSKRVSFISEYCDGGMYHKNDNFYKNVFLKKPYQKDETKEVRAENTKKMLDAGGAFIGSVVVATILHSYGYNKSAVAVITFGVGNIVFKAIDLTEDESYIKNKYDGLDSV